VPVVLMLFDLLHIDGRSLLDAPYDDRRALLEGLALQGPNWATPRGHRGPGSDVLAAARAGGLEGVVAKRRDARYRPGRRDRSWVKVRASRVQEAVVGGWAPRRGAREGTVGALLLGVPAGGRPLRLAYIGRVGTGFSDDEADDLLARLEPLKQVGSPFADELTPTEARGATWARPRLVVEVAYSEWTRTGRLRHPVWRGLRLDKRPAEVIREP
jgi:bifunctional non-homologous end joining protein LigD